MKTSLQSPHRSAAATTWNPSQLPKPTNGGWFRFGAAGILDSSVTLSGSNILSVTDQWGTGKSMAAPSGSIVPLGLDWPSGQAYGAIRAANVSTYYPCLVGASIGPTATNTPFTMAMVIRFKAAPSTANTTLAGFAQMGGTVGAASAHVVSLGCDNTSPGKVYAIYTNVGAQLEANFAQRCGGLQQSGFILEAASLADGTSAATIPAKAIYVVSYDGTTLKLWWNGILVNQVVTGYAITPTSAALIVGRFFNSYSPPDMDVFEILVTDYCWTTAQQKQYGVYAAARYGFPKTPACYTKTGDSIMAGYQSSNITTASYSQLAANMWTQPPYNQPVAPFMYNSGVTTTTTDDFLGTLPSIYPVANWADLTYAEGFDPLAVSNVFAYNFLTNDAQNALGIYWQANVIQIGALVKSWGYSVIIWESPPPYPTGTLSTYQTFITNAIAWMNSSGVAAGACTKIIDLTNTSDATTLAAAGIPAWAGTTAYLTSPSTTAQALATYGGHLWWCAISGTSGSSGGPTADNVATPGMWLDLGAATTLGQVASVVMITNVPHDGVHLGTNGGVGDCGASIVAVMAAAGYARALGFGTFV